MRIQIKRIHIERLLANCPNAARSRRAFQSIGIDTDEKTVNLIDETGRELSSVNVPMEDWNNET